ncbi:Uncharacterised protein [Streptococcus pneumoniae]|uniref:PncS n=1 Tax=Streptococcus pneumoniae TaxID=1313 RepID=A7XHK1_STREE|nr:PncS [Streptococcus pneumoniae]CIV66131.1 Uncharacterised protein [Streptococcus pneumoniae]
MLQVALLIQQLMILRINAGKILISGSVFVYRYSSVVLYKNLYNLMTYAVIETILLQTSRLFCYKFTCS